MRMWWRRHCFLGQQPCASILGQPGAVIKLLGRELWQGVHGNDMRSLSSVGIADGESGPHTGADGQRGADDPYPHTRSDRPDAHANSDHLDANSYTPTQCWRGHILQ